MDLENLQTPNLDFEGETSEKKISIQIDASIQKLINEIANAAKEKYGKAIKHKPTRSTITEYALRKLNDSDIDGIVKNSIKTVSDEMHFQRWTKFKHLSEKEYNEWMLKQINKAPEPKK